MLQEQDHIYTIAQITRRIKGLLEKEVGLVWVSGEISNWRPSASGHVYFTLKDADSQLDAVLFKGRMSRLKFAPENGLEVLARGTITVYERRGNYQLVIEELQPKGLGALQLAYEKRKKKLEAEGLFDARHKKKLPMVPRRIGIVTSPTGAAIRDILQIIRRRYAHVHIIIHPARVQGEGAAEEIAAGIKALDAWGVDVMIVGRGGGSLEDLWAFNEEGVVRTIFAAHTPIISAVGHEIDFTLADFAADLRAPTPSAAAELVVCEHQVLMEQVVLKRRRLERAMRRISERMRHRLDRQLNSFIFLRPDDLLRQQRQRMDEVRTLLERTLMVAMEARKRRLEQARRALTLLSPKARFEQQKAQLRALSGRLQRLGVVLPERARFRFGSLAARLNALSPIGVLARGYALAWKLPERELVSDASKLALHDSLSVWFGNGEVQVEVKKINPTGGIGNYDLRKET